MLKLLLVVALAILCGGVQAKEAARHAIRAKPVVRKVAKASAPAQTAHRRSPYVGAVSADVKTGKVFFSANADAEAYPASVTKLMTLLLVLEDVKAGRYALSSPVTATADVYRSEPSWVGLQVGDVMTVGDLCQALMVESANDAAIALAINSAGTFDAFIAKMNSRAAQLGMTRTRYYNPSGLPPSSAKRYPWKSFNVSTAADQMRLALVLVKMPEVLKFTSVKTCDLIRTPTGYRVFVTRRANAPLAQPVLAAGEKLVKHMRNHNNVMVKDEHKLVNLDGREAVDGLKTGYIEAGGSSVVLTGTRNGGRAVVVVLGAATSKERDANAGALMNSALDSLVW